LKDHAASPVPEGYRTVQPWVIPKGSDKFSQFMEEVFGAKEKKEAEYLTTIDCRSTPR
jgi:hypothetical protein